MVEDKPKGKPCNDCGSPLVNLYGSGGGRICSGCKSEFDWKLDKNQRPLIGSNRMSNTEVVVGCSKENSIDVGRHIDFIKQLVGDRNAASITLNIARQRMSDAEESLSNAEDSFSKAEDALRDAREKLKDYLTDEGVL